MKAILFFIALQLGVQVSFAQSVLDYEAITQQVKEDSPYTRITSLEVFQAQQNVEKARAQNRSRLNIFSVFKVVAGILTQPFGIVEALTMGESLGEVAPFLVPSNRFRIEENEKIYFSEKERFKAETSNEIFKVRAGYLAALSSEKVYESLEESLSRLENLRRFAIARERTRHIPTGTSDSIGISISRIQNEQLVQFQLSQQMDMSLLLQGIGQDIAANVTLNPVVLPDVEDLEPLNFEQLRPRLSSVSPELRQIDYLSETLPFVRNEVKYAFFGSSQIGRGSAGDSINSISVEGGLGVGRDASERLIAAQGEIFREQWQIALSDLEIELKISVDKYNSYLNTIPEFAQNIESAENLFRISMNNPNVLQRPDFQRLENEVLRIRDLELIYWLSLYDLKATEEKINRLLMTGVYSGFQSEYPDFLNGEGDEDEIVLSTLYQVAGSKTYVDYFTGVQDFSNFDMNYIDENREVHLNLYFEKANRFFHAVSQNKDLRKDGLKKVVRELGVAEVCRIAVITPSQLAEVREQCRSANGLPLCSNDIEQYHHQVGELVSALLGEELKQDISGTRCELWQSQ